LRLHVMVIRVSYRTMEFDSCSDPSKRWVLVAPPGAGDNAATLLLARAAARG
jgi:hypothetical protein